MVVAPSIFEALRAVISENFGGEAHMNRIGGYLDRSLVFSIPEFHTVIKLFLHAADKKYGNETSAYDQLRGTQFPSPQLLDSGRLNTGQPWIMISEINGTNAEECVREQSIDTIELFGALGGLLADLHHLPLKGTPNDKAAVFETQMDHQFEYCERAARTVNDAQPLLARALELMKTIRGDLDIYADELVFVHGDFKPRNVIAAGCNERPRILGIIDFEKAHIGHKAEDLCALFSMERTAAELHAFLQAYDDVDEQTWRFVTYFFCGYAAEIATWAPQADPGYYRSVMNVLRRVLAHAPRGDYDLYANWPKTGSL